MEERYRRPRDPMEVQGVATYSRFRRFQVSTTEELAPSTARSANSEARTRGPGDCSPKAAMIEP
jgi:hypothetical protein